MCNSVEMLSAVSTARPACVRNFFDDDRPRQITHYGREGIMGWQIWFSQPIDTRKRCDARFTALVHIFAPMSTDGNLGDLSSIRAWNMESMSSHNAANKSIYARNFLIKLLPELLSLLSRLQNNNKYSDCIFSIKHFYYARNKFQLKFQTRFRRRWWKIIDK